MEVKEPSAAWNQELSDEELTPEESDSSMTESDQSTEPLENSNPFLICPNSAVSKSKIYFDSIASFRYVTFPFTDENGNYKHAFGELAKTAPEPKFSGRITKEVDLLCKQLPCTLYHAIFVCADEQRMDLLKALVTGNYYSPYAFGMFNFDIYLPHNYPLEPPQVLCTTAKGQHRLNPCIDSEGKLCLGLLEEWDPQNSNLLSLLLAIQTLVFSEEPVYRDERVTENLEEEKSLFNLIANYLNLEHGMKQIVSNPPMEFEEVITRHFGMCEAFIGDKFLEWTEDIKEAINHKQILDKDLVANSFNPEIFQIFKEKSPIEVLENLSDSLFDLIQCYPKFGMDSSMSGETENSQILSDYEEEKGEPLSLGEASNNDPKPPESSTTYYQSLKHLRFNTHCIQDEKLQQSAVVSEQNLARFNKEMKVLSENLPCELTGSIFVAMDENNMHLMKGLISGTPDTPYEHGLYEFSIVCPANYPNSPPSVRILTTGNGSVRFNPNLYDDGYVCLSIINTWEGSRAERWNPSYSNILQVLLSIQTLVMDSDVIQKEPEYDHLATDSCENLAYCNIVKYNNVKWAMLEMIRNPPPEFAEIVWKHFALKKNDVIRTVERWLEEAKEFQLPEEQGEDDYLIMDHNNETYAAFNKDSYYSCLEKVTKELFEELTSFGDPQNDNQ